MTTALHTVTVDAAFLTPTEEVKTAKKFWRKYKVSGIYHRNGDHYSSWTLTGTVGNLKKCINTEWGPEALEDLGEI